MRVATVSRSGRSAWASVAGALSALALAATASALPEPRVKPLPPHHSAVLSHADFALLDEAMRAADDDDWSRVDILAGRISDPTARQLLMWRRALGDDALSFVELNAAATELADWPRAGTIAASADRRIGAAGFTPAEIVAWFDGASPRTGDGAAALIDALFQTGDTDTATAVLRSTWRSMRMPIATQRDLKARFGQHLTTDDHVARVDFLLWNRQRSAARALYGELPTAERRLADARVRLMTRSRGVDTAIDRVPNSLQAHPALLYERAHWRRRSRMTDAALPLVLDIPADAGPESARERVWTERRLHIIRTLRDGDADNAYQLAANHGLERGADFAEAEWRAGWIALQQLDEPDRAKAHFTRLADGVSTPISKARAYYWRARAHDAAGEPDEARRYYEQAAALDVTFYGQLAAQRIATSGAAVAELAPDTAPSAADRAAFDADPVVRAARLLSELDELRLFRTFSYHLDDRLETPAQIALLAELAQTYGQPGVATRSGRSAIMRGVAADATAYPLIDLPPLRADAPETAFLFALMRQESEFYPRAVSHAGARGLMQLMPATARSTARSMGRSYRKTWLTGDADYNVQVGSAHLADLLEEFDGSYVLAAAAYNAGASRAHRWIRQYGDPRAAHVDTIDWVESIPFSETRNYVQRVMENVQVYRARLSGGSATITLEDDLKRGG